MPKSKWVKRTCDIFAFEFESYQTDNPYHTPYQEITPIGFGFEGEGPWKINDFKFRCYDYFEISLFPTRFPEVEIKADVKLRLYIHLRNKENKSKEKENLKAYVADFIKNGRKQFTLLNEEEYYDPKLEVLYETNIKEENGYLVKELKTSWLCPYKPFYEMREQDQKSGDIIKCYEYLKFMVGNGYIHHMQITSSVADLNPEDVNHFFNSLKKTSSHQQLSGYDFK